MVIDSSDLMAFGAGVWPPEKHGGKPCRSWRRLHLAVDPDSGDILAAELTTKNGATSPCTKAREWSTTTLGRHCRAGGEQILDIGGAKTDFLQHLPGLPAARLCGVAQRWIRLVAADR